MIAYRASHRTVGATEFFTAICAQFRTLGATPPLEKVRRLLIDFGDFEAGLADALSSDIEMPVEETRIARRASTALGRLFAAVYQQRDWALPLERVSSALGEVAALLLPARLRISTAEGYAFYALYPETYVASALEFCRERRPQKAVVIGIRGIGASLSAAVSGALEGEGCAVRSCTVRPQGHPFDRALLIAPALEQEWRALRAQQFLIVDEGPGISGSTFASVADALLRCRVPAERISLFPSWDAQPESLGNPKARELWTLCRRYPAPVHAPFAGAGRDLSGGAWRQIVYGADQAVYPAVQPAHEARKHLTASGVLLKFAGLGAYAEAKLDRARRLAAAGFSPPALGCTDGFLAYEFVAGTPLKAKSPQAIERIAEYLAFRARSFPARRAVSFESMVEMVRVNALEALGIDIAADCFADFEAPCNQRPAIEVDGRMMPHEWIDSARGLLKTDSVDHQNDHFYPGPADVAWDLAGAAVGFALNATEAVALVDAYARYSGDRVPAAVIQFYRIAYLAFRIGYTSFGLDATQGSADHGRFLKIYADCSRSLRQEIAALLAVQESLQTCSIP